MKVILIITALTIAIISNSCKNSVPATETKAVEVGIGSVTAMQYSATGSTAAAAVAAIPISASVSEETIRKSEKKATAPCKLLITVDIDTKKKTPVIGILKTNITYKDKTLIAGNEIHGNYNGTEWIIKTDDKEFTVINATAEFNDILTIKNGNESFRRIPAGSTFYILIN